MNIFDQIVTDHKEVKNIFKQMTSSTATPLETRQQLLDKLQMELLPHMEAEESLLYHYLMERASDRMPVLEAQEEHHMGKLALRELRNLGLNEDRWVARATVLSEMIGHHIHEEETVVFKMAKKVIDSNLAADMGRQFQDEKNRLRSSDALTRLKEKLG